MEEQAGDVAARDVREVDARVGADEPMVRLGDDDAALHADDAAALLENELNQPRVTAVVCAELAREGRRVDIDEAHEPAFGLRDDLLADHQHVAGLEGRPLGGRPRHHEPGEVVAGAISGKPRMPRSSTRGAGGTCR